MKQKSPPPLFSNAFIAASLASVAAMLAACAPTVNTQGQVILPSHLAALQPGTSTKDDVRAQLGSPSTTDTFDPNRWYYISSQVEDKILRPHILLKRQVVIADFDAHGILTQLNQRTEADAKTISPVAATTPTHNLNTSFLSEFFGNLGFGGLPGSAGSSGKNGSTGSSTSNPNY